jgi:phytoene dehydrogenase-like protein
MPNPKVAVIGAGIAGLSVASYLQRNGFDTEIFELHDKPGGLCAAWTRKGYTFDGCIHWLMGSGSASNLHEIWKELGAGDLDYIEWSVYTVVGLSDGDTFTVYTDPDQLEREILRIAPEDESFARLFSSKVRAVMRSDMPAAFDKLRPREKLASLLAMPAALSFFAKYMKISVLELIGSVRSPKLREAFQSLFGEGISDFPAGGLFMMLGFMAKKSAGYPIGGSAAFARAIEAKYLSLGGKIHYGFKVDEAIVKDGRAAGVAGSGGVFEADYVISAADAYDTVKRLLGGAYAAPELEKAFDGGLKRFPSLLFLGLGLGRDCSDLPHSRSFVVDPPVVLEDGALKVDRIALRIFSFDPSLAPSGKTAAAVMIETTNDAYWRELAERDPAAYAARKREAADAVIAALDARIPGFASWVEVVDLATPETFVRYTNNWHGSYEGWLPTVDSLGAKLPRELPGLERFYMVGQWLNPGGGLPPCGWGGRELAKRLCRLEGKKFRPD